MSRFLLAVLLVAPLLLLSVALRDVPTASAEEDSDTYIVQPGDTLWLIAFLHGTDIWTLDALNNFENPDLILVGQAILLPLSNECRTVAAEVSAYSSTPDQTWGDPFITASGMRVHWGTVAAPPRFLFGTRVFIPGYGWGVVEDRGGKIYGNRFDVWMYTRWDAIQWGRQYIYIKVCN